jgi:ribosome biogenesis GTPase A
MAITRSKALSPAAEQALAEGRTLLAELRDRLARLPATEHDTVTLANSIQQLDDLFLLVVVGEFNAGKSALINALLGEHVVDEGVTPTTAQIELVGYGDVLARAVDASGMHLIMAPIALLRDLHVVDTPARMPSTARTNG